MQPCASYGGLSIGAVVVRTVARIDDNVWEGRRRFMGGRRFRVSVFVRLLALL